MRLSGLGKILGLCVLVGCGSETPPEGTPDAVPPQPSATVRPAPAPPSVESPDPSGPTSSQPKLGAPYPIVLMHGMAYGQSKLAQVMMTAELAPAFARHGVTMISLHPATLMDTTMVKGLGIPSRTTVAEGRGHDMGLIHARTLQAGAYYRDGQSAPLTDPQADDAAARARLAALSAELTGVPAIK